jgi:hypothetical protein
MTDTMSRTGGPPVGRRTPARGNPNQAPPLPVRPFVAGTRRIDEPDYDATVTMTTGTVDLPNYELSPNGYLTGLFVFVNVTTAGNAAAVAFQADAPFNVLSNISFQDTNSQPIVGPMTGWDLYCLSKYGGYAFQDDARMSPIFSATAGVGAGLGGSAQFCLYLPIEIVRRDALGALPNKSASSTFKLDLTVGSSGSVYSVAPTTLGTVRVRVFEVGWQDPNATDIRNNPVAQDPPGVQTTQFWNRQTYTLTSGAVDQRLQSIDALLRTLIIVARDENSSRAQGDTEFPDAFTLQYENSLIIESRLKPLWQHFIARDYGYTNTVETAGGRDNGVYPISWALDFMAKVGYETRYQYLPMSSASNLTIRGLIGGAGANLYTCLVNKVVPAGGNPLVLTGGR